MYSIASWQWCRSSSWICRYLAGVCVCGGGGHLGEQWRGRGLTSHVSCTSWLMRGRGGDSWLGDTPESPWQHQMLDSDSPAHGHSSVTHTQRAGSHGYSQQQRHPAGQCL